jgi:hypothetical protein
MKLLPCTARVMSGVVVGLGNVVVLPSGVVHVSVVGCPRMSAYPLSALAMYSIQDHRLYKLCNRDWKQSIGTQCFVCARTPMLGYSHR